ncbi:MAG: hypothetical protein WD872_14450 [Pirellulaceae bacterium]
MTLPTPPDERSLRAGHETADVNVRAILGLATATAAGVAIVLIGLWFLMHRYDALARASDPRLSPLADTKQTPPLPHLQAASLRDYRQYQQEQERLMTRYAWVDRAQGVVQIPVERAIDLYIERQQQPAEEQP